MENSTDSRECLDDRSLSPVIRDAKDNGKKALEILREHYFGKSKPKIISLYTELTILSNRGTCDRSHVAS